MIISKISTQNNSFGIKIDGLLANEIKTTELNLKKEAGNSIYYYPLDVFERSVKSIKTISPEKSLETLKLSNFGSEYSIKSGENFINISIEGRDPCFSKLASALKDLHRKGKI